MCIKENNKKELHIDEANRARSYFLEERKRNSRFQLYRVGIILIFTLVVLPHVVNVIKLNNHLKNLGFRSLIEFNSTVLGFLANHRELGSNNTMIQDEDSRLLLKILNDIGEIMGKEVTLISHGSRTIREIYKETQKRPNGIKIILPYLGTMTLPINYKVLALLAIFLAYFCNINIIIKYKKLENIKKYANDHFGMLEKKTNKMQLFSSTYNTESLYWNSSLELSSILTGISVNEIKNYSPFEIIYSMITTLSIIVIWGSFWYLIFEKILYGLPMILFIIFIIFVTFISILLSIKIVELFFGFITLKKKKSGNKKNS